MASFADFAARQRRFALSTVRVSHAMTVALKANATVNQNELPKAMRARSVHSPMTESLQTKNQIIAPSDSSLSTPRKSMAKCVFSSVLAAPAESRWCPGSQSLRAV
jgi:hypothetical protein